MCTGAGPSRLSLTNCIHARSITSRYWRTNSANEKEERNAGGWLRHENAPVASSQCHSIFGHAKRNCASEAYEPPLRFGMIVSSKAATSSNST